MNITIYFDGGCAPTNPGNKYGSWEIMAGKRCMLGRRVNYGYGTNNEAEFNALIDCLENLLTCINLKRMNPFLLNLSIFTDSKIVLWRIKKNKKPKTEPQHRMHALADIVLRLLDRFQSYQMHWNKRTVNVAKFGH